MFKKAKAKMGDAADATKSKMGAAKSKADDAAAKQMDDFLKQMSLLAPAMKDAAFRLTDVSIIIQVIPAISCEIQNTDETGDKRWDDSLVDESQLNKTGKILVWAMKRADQAREQFNKNAVVRFASFEFECTLAPVLKLSFEPRENDTNDDSKQPETTD
eukprot:1127619_1